MFGRKNPKNELKKSLVQVATYLDEKGGSFTLEDNTGLKSRWNVVLAKYSKISPNSNLQANISSLNTLIQKGINKSQVMGLLELLTAAINAVK